MTDDLHASAGLRFVGHVLIRDGAIKEVLRDCFNAIMLSNVADLSTVLSGMAADGHSVTPALVASLNPYARRHILRFGQYALAKPVTGVSKTWGSLLVRLGLMGLADA